MHVSIVFLLLALSSCFASTEYSYGYNQQQTTSMKQEDAYCYVQYVTKATMKYQMLMQSAPKDKDFQMKCNLHGLISVVKEMADELNCSVEEILHKMGLSGLNFYEMEAMIQSGGSVENLDPKKCENVLGNLLGGVLVLVTDVLGPLLGALSGVLESLIGPKGILSGVVGGILGGNGGGPLDGILGVLGGGAGGGNGGPLSGLLGEQNEIVGGVLGGQNGLGGLLG
ncbi:uncharacterized protein [Ambystoma mexicanum]|uniref:uncharacterized protein n=1 Tax=Ambystoma mexicanum TaxID=8296 RepID=UPI0037E9693D